MNFGFEALLMGTLCLHDLLSDGMSRTQAKVEFQCQLEELVRSVDPVQSGVAPLVTGKPAVRDNVAGRDHATLPDLSCECLDHSFRKVRSKDEVLEVGKKVRVSGNVLPRTAVPLEYVLF